MTFYIILNKNDIFSLAESRNGFSSVYWGIGGYRNKHIYKKQLLYTIVLLFFSFELFLSDITESIKSSKDNNY